MRPIRIALIVSLATCGAQIAIADPPPAEFTVSFDGAAAIWNPFDGFEACETVTDSGLTATLCLALDNDFCDGAGNCSCDAALDIEGDFDGLLTGDCKAKVSCKPTGDASHPVCKAKLSFSAVGSISALGMTCGAKVSNFVVNGPVDSAGLYHGKARAKVCVDCGGGPSCAGTGGVFDYAVNPPIPWQLTVAVTPDAIYPSNLYGTAEDSLGPFFYNAMGGYNPDTDETTITLKGVTRKADPDSVSQGAKIKLEKIHCTAGQCGGGTADVKVQGNKINDAPIAP